jgi:hypothetical protein
MPTKYIKYESTIGVITMPVHAISLEAQNGEKYLVRNVYTGSVDRVEKEVFNSIEKLLNEVQ